MTGKKFDQDKAPVVQGCFNYFARALLAVAGISAFGANKYKVQLEDKNWMKLDGAQKRYTDGDGRHLLGEAIDGMYDKDSGMLHAAHHAWNALARLELLLKDGIPLTDPAAQPKTTTGDLALLLNAGKAAMAECEAIAVDPVRPGHFAERRMYSPKRQIDADGGACGDSVVGD